MLRLTWLLFPFLLWADTGGLQRLPEMIPTPDISENGGFEAGDMQPSAWTFGSGWQWIKGDSSKCRSGSNCLAVSGVSNSAAVTNVVLKNRNARIRMWVRTEGGDPGDKAQIYVYVFDATHGGTAYACGATANRMPLSGGLAEWKQYTLCDEVTASTPHLGDTLSIRVIALDIPPSVKLYVDDVTVEPVVQPLVIFPIYPNYRGMLWPDQGTLIRWNAVVEPPPPLTTAELRVSVDIVRASDNAVLATLNEENLAAIATTGSWTSHSVNPQEYDASELEDGAYFLRGTLRLKSDNSEIYAYPDYKILKEAPAVQRDGWKVWVDRYNRVVLNGKPSFIWGAYFSINENAGNTYSTFVSGSRDCCQASTTADHYRALGLGCKKTVFPVVNITNTNPAVVTINNHGLSNGHYITFSGGTGNWTAVNGCHYWIGCGSRLAITVLDANRFSVTVDASAFPRFAGQQMTAVRGRCYEDDQALTPWNRSFGVNGSNLIRILGDFGMNAIIRYGNYASASGGINTSACAQYLASNDQISPWLEALQDVGAWHLHIVNHYAAGAIPLTWWDACLSGTDEEKQRQAVALNLGIKPVANNTGFMGLYIADEPSTFGSGQNFARAWNLYRAYQNLNAGGIAFWASTSPGQAYTLWNNVLDVHGIDPYPVGAGLIPDDYAYGITTGNKHGRSYNWPRATAAAVFDSRPSWAVPQLWRQSGAWPEPADFKIQIVSALAAGSTGILWWQLGGPSTTPGLALQSEKEYLEFQATSKVITELRPILAEPILDLSARQDGQPEYGRLIESVSDPEIRCASRQRGADILLACANTTKSAKTVTIRMTHPIQGDIVLPWSGEMLNQQSAPGDNAFTVQFAGLSDATAPENSVHLILLRQAAVVNAASFLRGPVSPGEIVSIFGTELAPVTSTEAADATHESFGTSIAGTRVLFDEVPASLLFVSPEQINGAVPYGVAGNGSARVTIERDGKIHAQMTVYVTEAKPGIFTADSSGSGPAAALNEDGTLNTPSNPAHRGSMVILYATGAGQMNPAAPDRQVVRSPAPEPSLPVSVHIGGREATVIYKNAAVGHLPGILQVNVIVPMDAPSGAAIPVSLTAGNAVSQPGVTLSIQ